MPNKRTALTSASLPALEGEICLYLKKFFDFSSHALYFPDAPLEQPEYLPQERRLLLPLFSEGKNLGVLILDRVSKNARRLLPDVANLASLALELAATKDALDVDPETGLANEPAFYSHLGRIVDGVAPHDSGQINSATINIHQLCLGMIVLLWQDSSTSLQIRTHAERNAALAALGMAIKAILPQESVASFLGRHEGRRELGIIMPAPDASACRKVASRLLDSLENVQPIWNPAASASALFAGCAIYPQDMNGDELRLPLLDQTIILRDRARLAASHARIAKGGTPAQRTLDFNSILRGGGKIIDIPHGSVLLINLGRKAGAAEGMRFQTIRQGVITGQIAILEAREHDSVAEILFTGEGGVQPEAGDSLRWLSLDESAPASQGIDWLGHARFFRAFADTPAKRFALGITRLTDKAQRQALLALIDGALSTFAGPLPELWGQYGATSLIFYHSGKLANEARGFYEWLTALCENAQLDAASGIFQFPFLEFAKRESESCALKALECAALLPKPRICVFDSLALNISADKLSSMGDAFGAIKEYELAIMADKTNSHAWNSLGVALAALGKDDEAFHNFREALRHCEDPALCAKIHYNLGVLHQKSEETRQARIFFKKCLGNDPGHAFAWLRLAQLDMRRGKKREAAEACAKALELSGGNREIANAARRQLAAIKAAWNNMEEARALLHESLVAEPNDAATLCSLAKLYLVDNEDPGMAEMLAARSVALGSAPEAEALLEAARQAKRNQPLP